MAINVDAATLTTLVAQQAVLFDHAITVSYWVAGIAIVFFLLTYWLGYAELKNADVCVGSLVGIVFVVMVWVVWRVDTYFEVKQFERAPETYVIKRLR